MPVARLRGRAQPAMPNTMIDPRHQPRPQGAWQPIAPPRVTLARFHADWWDLYAVPNLSPKTLELYRYLWRALLEPGLGERPLQAITTVEIERWKLDLTQRGVGPETIRRTLTMLQGVFARAVEWDYLETNPVARVRKPRTTRRRLVRPLAPLTVERIRDQLGLGSANAALVSVLAYAGLRPGEALALTWGAVGERLLLVEQSASMGQLGETKTGAVRTVRLLAPLKDDLAQLRAIHRERPARQLVFPDRAGAVWTDDGWRNWRRRVFAPAAARAGAHGARPYDLRHSFVSLLIAEGRNVIDVARQAGHSPTMTLQTYGHVFDEFDGSDRQTAEERIIAARHRKATLECDRVH
jgi:integrase